jgi:hypothetical protein
VVANNFNANAAVTGTTFVASGNISGANVNASSGVTATTVSATGNITGGNLISSAVITSVGNIIGGNLITGGLISATGKLDVGGQITSTGAGNAATNGGQIFLNGATNNRIDWNTNGIGAPEYTTRSAGAKVVLFPSIGGSATDYALGVEAGALWSGIPGNDGGQFFKWYGGNVLVASLSGTGAFSATGNITGGNLTTSGVITATDTITGGNLATAGTTSAGGNITGANLTTGGVITATGNITGGNLITAGLVSLSSITKTGSNGVGNIGQSDNSFNTIFAKATSAQYADLAEMYCADADYQPGTVLSFGGTQEVTISTQASDPRVAGVVSTNPAHLMNSTLDCDCAVALALTGRVPTQVTGQVRKGDMMVSAGNGHAQACATPAMGTVIGKALEDFDGDAGTIEIVVGRM